MSLSRICFHGATQVSMSISVTGSFPMTRPVSAILPATLSVPVFLKSAWSSFCPLGYIPAKDSHDGTAKVVYTSKDRKSRKTFNAMDWLARLVTHIPGRYEQTVRYYGWYSNKSRGMIKKADQDNTIPAVISNEISSKEFRQSWARKIKFIGILTG